MRRSRERLHSLLYNDRKIHERCGGLQNTGMWEVIWHKQARRKVACYDQTAHYHFMLVAGALVEISGEFHDNIQKVAKTEEASASSASMLATPLKCDDKSSVSWKWINILTSSMRVGRGLLHLVCVQRISSEFEFASCVRACVHDARVCITLLTWVRAVPDTCVASTLEHSS